MACANAGESPVSRPHVFPAPALSIVEGGDPSLPTDVRLLLRRRLPLRTVLLGLRRRGGDAARRAPRECARRASPVPLRSLDRGRLRPRASLFPLLSARRAHLAMDQKNFIVAIVLSVVIIMG